MQTSSTNSKDNGWGLSKQQYILVIVANIKYSWNRKSISDLSDWAFCDIVWCEVY